MEVPLDTLQEQVLSLLLEPDEQQKLESLSGYVLHYGLSSTKGGTLHQGA